MNSNPTVLGTCDRTHRWESEHKGLHPHWANTPFPCHNWKPQAEPLRESQPSGVEDDGPLSVCTECGMPKCDCGVEGEGPTKGEWAKETMRIVNELTPLVTGKAFDPDWFLLRARFEAIENKVETLMWAVGVKDKQILELSDALSPAIALLPEAGAPKEIELPALDAEYQRDKPWEIAPGYDEPTQQLHCRERQLLATIAERDASLTREREKDEEIARLKAALEEAVAIFNGELGSDWADSFYPFWRMCEGIFIERMPDRATYRDAKRADDLQQRAEKAVEILNAAKAAIWGMGKESLNCQHSCEKLDAAIALLTAPKENSNAG